MSTASSMLAITCKHPPRRAYCSISIPNALGRELVRYNDISFLGSSAIAPSRGDARQSGDGWRYRLVDYDADLSGTCGRNGW
jgi:hypothetical protein